MLEQKIGFHVGITIVRILDFSSFTEPRVRFIEEKYGTASVGGIKQPAQAFFRFSNVFVDYLREINAVQVELELSGDNLGGHRFSGTALARK